MIGLGLIAAILNCCLSAAEEAKVTVEPERIDDLFANPGMGWQTFHRFADEDENLAGLPSSSAYFRLYWSQIEPVEGQIDFAQFDDLLARARKAGQKLAFRVMCAGTNRDYMHVPQWLKDKGCKGFEYQYREGDPKHWVPDMDDPIFKEAHFRLIEELGNRYDGHPDLDLVDIGSVGLWGEWHMSGTGVDVPIMEMRLAIIDAYIKAFPRTPTVMLIGDVDCMRYATGNGSGWRADCLGDMGGFQKTWNHMENCYPQNVEKSGATEVWKTAPVAFESCWDMRKWKDEGWDIRYIFDYALDYHVSYLNNKSAPIPEGTRDEVERFLRKMGYRFTVRLLEHDRVAAPGSSLMVSIVWENVGVAPPYRDYLLALRLTNDESKETFVLVNGNSVKNWIPGIIRIYQPFDLPEELQPGSYELAIALVDPDTSEPAIRLAIAGRTEDDWYPLSQLEIK